MHHHALKKCSKRHARAALCAYSFSGRVRLGFHVEADAVGHRRGHFFKLLRLRVPFVALLLEHKERPLPGEGMCGGT